MHTQWILIFLILTTQIGTLGCHSRLKNPETKDPIYLDLVNERDSVLSQLNSLKTDVAKAKIAYDEAPIRTGQRQDAELDYFELKAKEQKLIEKYRYLAVSVEKRVQEDQKLYNESQEKGLPWPNPQELQDFTLEKRLKNAPREWSPHLKEKDQPTPTEKTTEGQRESK